ncbi:MAG: hypothetical protein ACE5HA_15105 [Anaerolineae bacterium]
MTDTLLVLPGHCDVVVVGVEHGPSQPPAPSRGVRGAPPTLLKCEKRALGDWRGVSHLFRCQVYPAWLIDIGAVLSCVFF